MKQLHNCRNRKQIYTPLSLSLILSLLIGQLGGRGGSWPLCVRQMIQQILGQSGALQKHKAFGDHAAVLPGITISMTKKKKPTTINHSAPHHNVHVANLYKYMVSIHTNCILLHFNVRSNSFNPLFRICCVINALLFFFFQSRTPALVFEHVNNTDFKVRICFFFF